MRNVAKPDKVTGCGAVPARLEAETEAEVRSELVAYFEEVGRGLRLPPSIGKIYGVLFASTAPLSFDEIATRLELSKGAVSQGLHVLEEMKAITPTKIDGDRRTFFQPEISLRRLTQTFITDVMAPRLEAGRHRIDALQSCLGRQAGGTDADADAAHLADRVRRLRIWQTKLRRLLPWIARLAAPPGRPGAGSSSGPID